MATKIMNLLKGHCVVCGTLYQITGDNYNCPICHYKTSIGTDPIINTIGVDGSKNLVTQVEISKMDCLIYEKELLPPCDTCSNKLHTKLKTRPLLYACNKCGRTVRKIFDIVDA